MKTLWKRRPQPATRDIKSPETLNLKANPYIRKLRFISTNLGVVFTYTVAALVIGSPGVLLQFNLEEREDSVLSSILGPCVENGIFLLLGTHFALHHFSRHVFFSYLLAMALLVFLSRVGDLVYQQRTGGDTPSMWLVASMFSLQQVQRQGSNQLTKEETDASFVAVISSLWAVLSGIAGYAAVRIKLLHRRKCPLLEQYYPRKTLGLALLATLTLYLAGARMPTTHVILCFGGSFVMSPPGGSSTVQLVLSRDSSSIDGAPNVILILHESLSGSLMEKTPQGKKSTPYFNSLLADNPDFYRFEYARSVAAKTDIAIPVTCSGFLPFAEKGMNAMMNRSLASVFKSKGYMTILYRQI